MMLKRNSRRIFSDREVDAFRRVEMLTVLGLSLAEALSLCDVARDRHDLWTQSSAMPFASESDQTVRLKNENLALRKMLAEALMSAPSLRKWKALKRKDEEDRERKR